MRSRLDWSERDSEAHARWLDRYRRLLTIRRREIVPRLRGMMPGGRDRMLGPKALRVEWTLGDGSELVLLANFGDTAVPLGEPVDGDLVYCSGAAPGGDMASACAAFLLRRAR